MCLSSTDDRHMCLSSLTMDIYYQMREEEGERGKGRRGSAVRQTVSFIEVSRASTSDSTLVLSVEYCSNERIKILPMTKLSNTTSLLAA